ncbi:MAG: hypothetical protein M3540_08790 [Actinomycetota bacterium]|nr:hypothetical protein [Actinomycetota bacterium]
MPEIVEIPISDLLLSSENPRLSGASSNLQETALELAQKQPEGTIKLAEDIVSNGLDPTALPAVVATSDRRKRYRVLEGNRRILALRALETPALISPVLSPALGRRLNELSAKYESDPLYTVTCTLFATEDEALHWIELRHTGMNQGVGLVEWGSDEKARFRERHAGKRNPSRQFIEFVEGAGELSDAARASNRKILTNVERLIETTYVREKLGIDVAQGELVGLFPAKELAKGMTRVVEDLKTGKITVPQLYHAHDRRKYIDSLPSAALPKKSTRLDSPALLDDLASGATEPRPVPKRKPRPRTPTRTTVIPKTAQMDVALPRINRVYNELLSLNAEQYPNACSVMLRVFIELSVDHYISDRQLMTETNLRNTPLGKRLKLVAEDLHKRSLIPMKLRRAVETAASSKTVLGPSLVTLHQYVHNEYVFPKSADLYASWDELEPFVAQLWPTT